MVKSIIKYQNQAIISVSDFLCSDRKDILQGLEGKLGLGSFGFFFDRLRNRVWFLFFFSNLGLCCRLWCRSRRSFRLNRFLVCQDRIQRGDRTVDEIVLESCKLLYDAGG